VQGEGCSRRWGDHRRKDGVGVRFAWGWFHRNAWGSVQLSSQKVQDRPPLSTSQWPLCFTPSPKAKSNPAKAQEALGCMNSLDESGDGSVQPVDQPRT